MPLNQMKLTTLTEALSFLPVTCQGQSPTHSTQTTYHHPIPLRTATPAAPVLISNHEEDIKQEPEPVPTAIPSGSNPNQEKDLASRAGLSQ